MAFYINDDGLWVLYPDGEDVVAMISLVNMYEDNKIHTHPKKPVLNKEDMYQDGKRIYSA